MEEEEQSLENILPLAHDIRCVIDELLRHMSLLPDKERVPDSSHLLAIFDQLSAVISEKTIVEAASFADEGFVKLHMSDPTAPESTELEGEVRAVSQAWKLEDDPDLVEIQIPLNVLQSQITSLEHHLTSAKLSQMSSSHDSCEILFGAVSQKPDPIEEPSSEPSGMNRRIFEVYCGCTQDLTYYILPDINYCTCDHFQNEALRDRADFTCPHILATWISQALDTVTMVQSPPDLLNRMFSYIIDRIE